MSSRNRFAYFLPVLAAVGLSVLGCSKPSSDPTAANDDRVAAQKDEATLGPAEVDLFIEAVPKLNAYAEQHPKLDKDEIGADTSESPAEYAARVEASPDLKAAFTATGIDPKAFARSGSLLTGAMFGAAMAQGKDPSTLPQPVQYYLAHKADIDQRIKDIEASAG